MLTLGSLFDGIGGFPLSGVMHGIKPVWASEIEPFPILVTTRRFPDMKHLGSVTDIKGDQVEPVDILTFGSPCQDLSVAGAQKGIHEGARSSLFFEAVRIIKEMREHDRNLGRTGKHVRCRWAVWENVLGALGSNAGADFQAVLQALCEVADPDVHVPFPEGGKWQKAGCIVGEGYSVAWRTLDAQYFPRTPQRRKRIYLVADFGSERAGEILFKPHSVRGNPEEGGKEGQGTAEDAQGCAGRSGCVKCLNPWYSQTIRQCGIDGVHPALAANTGAGQDRHGVLIPVGIFMGGQGEKAGSIAYNESVSPSLRGMASGSNQVPDVVCAIEGNVVDRASRKNGKGYCENVSPTLNTQDRHAIVFDCRNMVGNEEISGTLQAKNEGGFSLNVINPVVYSSGAFGSLSEGVGCLGTGTRATAEMVAVYDTTQITCPNNYSNPKAGDLCHPLAAQQHPPLAVYPEATGALCANSHPGSYTGQDAFNDMLPVVQADPPRKYIVRRLTPLECCRLKGYPDGWTEGLETYAPTKDMVDFFTEVWARWAAINGTKPKSRSAVFKWLQAPASDSAQYKAYGNSLAIPCSSDVLGRIAAFVEEERCSDKST